MATSLWQLLKEYKVVIPIIQRDFAQGRQNGKVPVVRERFLRALYNAISTSQVPLELDFVYGYMKENKNGADTIMSFIPLDGQQRLTTLFLLHWFVAVKEKHIGDAMLQLSKFTYETRHSSRVFCEKLVAFNPDFSVLPISEIIIDQPWFFTAWKNDPTISSMLVMLDAIQEKFSGVENMWPLLTADQARIVFHLLPMEKLGLPDDLYIKMNSRGKELTDFEYFKSQFSQILSDDKAEIFNNNIDQAWSDLFWNLYKNENEVDIAKLVDYGFLRFFTYVTDLLIARHDIAVESLTDEFSIYHEVYKNEGNVEFLFSCLNVFCASYLNNPGFFESVFYTEENEFETTKTRLFFQSRAIDLFKGCSDCYDATQRNNPFSIGEQLMLYACIEHLRNDTTDFTARIRKLRNLITNSEDYVRKENMQPLLFSVSEIILNGKVDIDSKFNSTQVSEEEMKHIFLQEKNKLAETIYKLEDHHLLQGCIASFKLEDELIDYASTFQRVFAQDCDYDTISKVLLTFGDYSQKYDWRRRMGNRNNSVWRELLTPSQRRSNFEQTKEVLYSLLTHLNQKPQSSLESIINDYLAAFDEEVDKPRDWRYYFIKYPEFRRHEDGFYTWWPKFDKPYECLMMRRTTLGGFHWSPFLFTLKTKFEGKLDLDNMRAPLVLVKDNASLRITNINEGYLLEASDDESKDFLEKIQLSGWIGATGILQVRQNQEGVDLEDRIEKAAEVITNILAY